MTLDGSAHLRIELLGPVRAWRAHEELALGSAHRRAVLAVLAMRANQVVARTELIDAIWGESAPASANGSIYTYVSGLRTALEPDRARRSEGRVLASAGSGYCLRLEPGELDVQRFDALREQARQATSPQDMTGARKALDAALGLWNDEALAGIPGPFAAAQRARLAELRLSTLEARAQVILDSGGHQTIVDELFELAREHPLREGIQGLLLLALYRSGRRAEALEAFQRISATTIESLGTEPGPALHRLHRQILADDTALGRTGGTAKPIPIVSRPRPSRPAVFTGRERETAILRSAVAAVAGGAGASLWIEGEPGIGKSALLAEGLAETPGCQLAWARADELGQRLPLRVILDCLDVTAHSADPRRAELATTARKTESDPGGDAMPSVVDGVLKLVTDLCGEGPLILVADELQWADPASLVVWRHLAAETRRLPLLLIGACRPVPRGPELERLRAEAGTPVVTLGPISEVAVGELITGILGASPGGALLAFGASAAGNPFYIREIVETLARDGDLERTSMPSALVSQVAHHLDFLSPRTREMLRWATLFGDDFTVDDLSAALGKPPGALAKMIGEARAAGVFAESHGRLTFRHPLVRRALYDKTPAAIRIALHRQLAEALSEAGAPADKVAGQLTTAAVPVDPWVRDWLLAEVSTLAARAPVTALKLVRRAIASKVTSGDVKETLTAKAARLMFWLGREPEAEVGYVVARTADSVSAAEMRWILAYLNHRRGDTSKAVSGIQDALRDKDIPETWRSRHESLLSLVRHGDPLDKVPGFGVAEAYWLGRWDDVLAELDAVLRDGTAIASYALGPPGSLRLVHGVAALIAGHRGKPEEARAHLQAARDQPMSHPSDVEGADFMLAASALVTEQDSPEEALDLLTAMLEPDYPPAANRYRWLPGLVRLAMELGERGRARFGTLLCERAPGQETVALRCRALLDSDPDQMLRAAEFYRLGHSTLEFAQTMEDAAVLLTGQDRLAEATTTFRISLESYAAMDAGWDVRRAERRMHALRSHG
jgi:DNA-binding SARP family transcriptional activator